MNLPHINMTTNQNASSHILQTSTFPEKKKKPKTYRLWFQASLALGLIIWSIPFQEQMTAVNVQEKISSNEHDAVWQQSLSPVIYVNEASTAVFPDGKSWSSAYPSLTHAFRSTMSGKKEIWIAKGTYAVQRDSEQTKGFSLVSEIQLYGGFKGSETKREQRDWKMNATVLSGMKANKSDVFQNVYNLVLGSGVLSITMEDSPSPSVSAQPELMLYIARKECEVTPVL